MDKIKAVIEEVSDDHVDDHVDEEIQRCFSKENPKCFFVLRELDQEKPEV